MDTGWTVVGYYQSNEEVRAIHITATHPLIAIENVRAATRDQPDFTIIGAIPGLYTLHKPEQPTDTSKEPSP